MRLYTTLGLLLAAAVLPAPASASPSPSQTSFPFPLPPPETATATPSPRANRPPVMSATERPVTLGATPAPLDATDPEGGAVTYDLLDGQVPTGTRLRDSGEFTGTATAEGRYRALVSACDDGADPACALPVLTFTVSAGAPGGGGPPIADTGLPAGALAGLATLLLAAGLALRHQDPQDEIGQLARTEEAEQDEQDADAL